MSGDCEGDRKAGRSSGLVWLLVPGCYQSPVGGGQQAVWRIIKLILFNSLGSVWQQVS